VVLTSGVGAAQPRLPYVPDLRDHFDTIVDPAQNPWGTERALRPKPRGLPQGAKGWKSHVDHAMEAVEYVLDTLAEQKRRAARFPRTDASGSWDDFTWHDEPGYDR
jgi:hypothetical protein